MNEHDEASAAVRAAFNHRFEIDNSLRSGPRCCEMFGPCWTSPVRHETYALGLIGHFINPRSHVFLRDPSRSTALHSVHVAYLLGIGVLAAHHVTSDPLDEHGVAARQFERGAERAVSFLAERPFDYTARSSAVVRVAEAQLADYHSCLFRDAEASSAAWHNFERFGEYNRCRLPRVVGKPARRTSDKKFTLDITAPR